MISIVWAAPRTYQKLIKFFLGINTRDSDLPGTLPVPFLDINTRDSEVGD